MEIRTNLLTYACIAASLSIGLWACGSGSADDSEETVKVERSALDSLNEKIRVFAELNNDDQETLLKIMKDLDDIADEAFAMGRERQLNGKVKDMQMVDKIKFKLATVQTELNQARNKAENKPTLQATIDDLQGQIIAQNEYIRHLSSTIKIKKGDLRTRHAQLEATREDLRMKKQECEHAFNSLNAEKEKLESTKSSSWTDAGDKLVASAEQVQIVRKHGKLSSRTKEAKKRILRRAVSCYHKASSLGDASASQKASRAEMTIQKLNAE